MVVVVWKPFPFFFFQEADGVEGSWTSLLETRLSDVRVEPCSHLYVESIRRSDRKPHRSTDDDDDPNANVAKEFESKV